jgi:hypothetical protein
MEQIKFVICFPTVYFTVLTLAHIIWCSVFGISVEPCIARDISDVVSDMSGICLHKLRKPTKRFGYCGQYLNLVPLKIEKEHLNILPRSDLHKQRKRTRIFLQRYVKIGSWPLAYWSDYRCCVMSR